MTTLADQLRRDADSEKLAREIVTPEGVPIKFQLASAGDRAAGFMLDVLIQVATLFAIGLVFTLIAGKSESSLLTPIIIVLAFVVTNFYFAFFEARWQGSTPGKRKIGMRVIDARGGQLETGSILARNLVRELEIWMPIRFLASQKLMWPGAPAWSVFVAGLWTFVFLFFPLFNKDRLRVGDLIAGTRVVMRPKTMLMPDLVDETAALAAANRQATGAMHVFTDEQLGVYGIYELQVLEGVLRTTGMPMAQIEAIATVANRIRWKLKYQGPVRDDERFLRDFYAALRAHLEQKMLFGQRREDKFSKR